MMQAIPVHNYCMLKIPCGMEKGALQKQTRAVNLILHLISLLGLLQLQPMILRAEYVMLHQTNLVVHLSLFLNFM